MVVRIETKKLLSNFDYNITLDNEEITILTGPNGYGKSTILKLIESFNNFKFEFFFNLDFEEIKFKFESLDFILKKCNDKVLLNNIDLEEIIKFYKKNLVDFSNEYNQFDIILRNNKDKKNVEYIINEQIHKLMNEFLKEHMEEPKEDSKKEIAIKHILDNIKKYRKNILFISDQRLLKNQKENENIVNLSQKQKTVINQISDKIKLDMNKLLKEHSNKSNFLEKTYPQRLLNINFGISEFQFKIEINKIIKKFQKLEEYGLSNSTDMLNIVNNLNYSQFDEEYSKSLKIYCEDFTKKYKVYEEFIKKLDFFKKILNEKFSFKKVKISHKNGLEIINTSNIKIPLELLSSGEKQQIIIYYNLIFELKNNTLLLIDEPEISLHIAWQRMFLDDLKEITNKKNVKAIIATHSPQILTHNWNLQVDLGELHGNYN